MRRVFNLGVGFVVVVPAADEARALAVLERAGESPARLGVVVTMAADTPFEDRVVFP